MILSRYTFSCCLADVLVLCAQSLTTPMSSLCAHQNLYSMFSIGVASLSRRQSNTLEITPQRVKYPSVDGLHVNENELLSTSAYVHHR
jgi:hypothetical protein